MKNLLALAGAALLTFAAVGWYLDWYKVGTTSNEEGGTQVTISFNNQKISADLKQGQAKLRNILDNATEDKTVSTAQQQSQHQPNTNQNTQSPSNHGFEITDDGFFVLPGNVPTRNPNERPYRGWFR